MDESRDQGSGVRGEENPQGVSPSIPAWRSARAWFLFVVLFVFFLAADLAVKDWAFKHVPPEGKTLVPNLLALTLTKNQGAVFGVMQGQKLFFVFASVAAVGFIGYFFAQSRAREWVLHVALAAILGGAMGNLYDRIEHGAVRDMLHLLPGVKLPWGMRWWGGMDEVYPWIFNVADVCLLVGIVAIFVRSYFLPKGRYGRIQWGREKR